MKFNARTTFLGTKINTSQSTGKSYRVVNCLDDTVSFTVMAGDLNMDFSDCEKYDILDCVFDLYLGNNYTNLRLISYERVE